MRSLKERWSLLSAVIALVMFASGIAVAQQLNDVDPDLQQGLKAFGQYTGGEFDSIDVTTTKLTVHIPLLSYQQLGKLHLNYSIQYDSPSFTQYCFPPDPCSYGLIATTLHDMNSVAAISDLMRIIQGFDSFD